MKFLSQKIEKNITSILEKAWKEKRNSLFEHEVYEVLKKAEVSSSPQHHFFPYKDFGLVSPKSFSSDRVVLKIVHPDILHKTDVGGVRIVSKSEIKKEISKLWKTSLTNAARKKGATFKDFQALAKGVLASEFVESPTEFGNELFLGMRLTQEFGPILSMGLGGINTELFAQTFKKNSSHIISQVGLFSPRIFQKVLEKTVAYQTLLGIARGHEPQTSSQSLLTLVNSFALLVRTYSPHNPKASFWLTEFEINPFVFVSKKPIALDGLLKFQEPEKPLVKKALQPMEKLLFPETACVLGVSSKGRNVGRIILNHLLEGKLKPQDLAVVKNDTPEIDQVRCYPTLQVLPKKYDLFVVSTSAPQVPSTIQEIVKNDKAHSIILVTGGMGEKKEGKILEKEVRDLLSEARKRKVPCPVLVGGNSMGIISRPGGYDSFFVPKEKVPRNLQHPLGKNVALVSQSGAFMISRMNKLGHFVPQYAISTGNEIDLSVTDFLEFFSQKPEIDVVGCYIEGFKWGEGVRFARIAQAMALKNKKVVVYKAGRSELGKKAASGHTASMAGDYEVASSILTQAGCLVAETFDTWSDLLMMASYFSQRPIQGRRIAAISNAGYETVGMADVSKNLFFAKLHSLTLEKIQTILSKFNLSHLQDIRNPMDLTPMANDEAHVEVLVALAEDPHVDVLVHSCVPLTAAIRSLPKEGFEGEGMEDPNSFSNLLIRAYQQRITKPVIVVIDSGSLYDPMANQFLEARIPVFRSADRAIAILCQVLFCNAACESKNNFFSKKT